MIFALAAATCGVACAEPEPPATSLPGLAATTTEGVHTAMLVERASAWRVAPEWSRVWEAALAVEPLKSRTPAWAELAGLMQRSPEACFDDLVGSRAGLVFESSGAWSIVSDVNDTSSASLEDALKSAPRGIEKGQPVSLIDRGRFSLAKVLASNGASGNRLSLCEMGSATNAERVTGSLAGLESLSKAASGGSSLGSGAFAWTGLAPSGKETRFAGAFVRKGNAAEFRFVTDPLMFGTVGVVVQSPRPPATGADDTSVLLKLRGRLPTPLMGELEQATRAIRVAMTLMKTPAPDPNIFGPEMLLEVAIPSPGTACITGGISLKNATTAADQSDKIITTLLEAASRAAGTEPPKLPDLGAAAKDPLAIRLVTFDGGDGRPQSSLAWACFAGEPGADGVRPGWFVVQLRTGEVDRNKADAELRRTGETMLAPWPDLFEFRIRPSKIAAIFGDPKDLQLPDEFGSEATAWIKLASTIELVEARFTAASADRVEGTGRIVAVPK